MSDDILLEQREGTVARLILNRPDARNALSLALLDALEQAFMLEPDAKEGIGAFIEKRTPSWQPLGED